MARLQNIRQEAFCQAYSKSGNATEAYKEAGYKWKDDASANAAASRLLRNVKVSLRIKELGDRREKASIASADEIREILSRYVRGEADELGDVPKPSIRLKAADMLCRMYGEYAPEKLEVSGNVDVSAVLKRAKERVGDAKR